MSKRKIGYIVVLTALIGFVLYIYDGFNGNPVSKYFSTRALENYLEETYPDKELRIDRAYYDFKFGGYGFNVIEIGTVEPEGQGPKKYEYSVRGFWKPRVVIDGIYYDNLDEDLMTKMSNEASEEIETLLSEKIDTVYRVEVQVEFLKGQFSADTSWNKALKFDKPIYIYVLLDATNAKAEDVLADAKEIQALLNQNGYVYDSVNVNANYIDENDEFTKDGVGPLKYAIPFSKNTKLSKKNIKEFN